MFEAAVVIDNGSAQCKAGIAGEESPRCSIPSIVGRHNELNLMDIDKNEIYLGEQAYAKRSVLNLKNPIRKGIVIDWDDMERIWNHVYVHELKVNSDEHPILLTEAPYNPKANGEKMIQIFFETFNVPAYYVTISAVLAFYANGRITGIAVESGDCFTHTVPIYDGFAISDAILRSDLAGGVVTDQLANMLGNSTTSSPSVEKTIVRDIKEKLCYVAIDYEVELQKYEESDVNDKQFELPDNNIILIKNQRFRCPEILFNPSFNSMAFPSIHELTYKSIMRSDIDCRKDLYSNILISGGNTMFPGMVERLSKEVTALAPQTMRIRVVGPPYRKHSIWIGGSIVSSLQSFQALWITKAEYEESGPIIVHKKCFI